MNAIRTFATPDSDGKLTIQVPLEYRDQEVEVIVLPVADYGIPRDKYFFENLAKMQTRDKRNDEMRKAMAEMARQAAENGLTPEIFDDIFNNPE